MLSTAATYDEPFPPPGSRRCLDYELHQEGVGDVDGVLSQPF